MPSNQENWHRGQNSLEPVSYSFCWIEEKYFETKSTSGWPSHFFGLYILSKHIFILRGKIYWWRLLLLFVRWADSGGWSLPASFSRAPAHNPLLMKIRVWARTSRVCQRGTFSPLILGLGTFWNKQLHVCLLCGLDFSVLWFEKRVSPGNKHWLTGLVLHVVFWVLGLQLLVAYD